MTAVSSSDGQAHAHQRLEHLYEISKLFASFENVEQTLDPALGIVAKALPLHSASMLETHEGRSRMLTWGCAGQTSEHLQPVKANLEAAYRYLVGAASTEPLEISEQAGTTPFPPRANAATPLASRFIVIPLVVARQPPFGALQLEGAQAFDKADLMFVNAIANQLAIALDRDRSWRQDIARRENAEERRVHAEQMSATADRRRRTAESSSEKYEALAAENARLYQQAQQAVRVREQVLAIVSHDLRNPLGTIVLTTSTLAKMDVVPQAVGRIQRAAERMLRLIEDLLDFASIEAGTLAMRRRPEDAGRLIQESLASFEGIAQEKGLELTAEVGPRLPNVFCDRDRCLQVLANLVGNAAKATTEGGHVTVRVEAREHELLFAVADDGAGIGADDAKHIFERYWRSGEAEYKGTGLGLAISRGIIDAHGGRMWVESELGRGSTFFFTIPAADETALFRNPSGFPVDP